MGTSRPPVPGNGGPLSALDAEAWLSSLDPIGWRFGLERIQVLLAELDEPQRAFESVHVVGTNGKSSVALMIAALLEASGRATGAYVSPHLERWSQRVRVRGAEIEASGFGTAAGQVAAAIAAVERDFDHGERITQFEAATAIAFVALASAGVEVAVIEAGLGGRLDATNVLPSRATVLTSVGLDHTAWLGETEAEIAAEKLAVLREGSCLVLGQVSDEVAALGRSVASDRGAELITAGEPPTGTTLAAPYLRRNLGVAMAAAQVVAGPLDPATVEAATSAVALPGRFELVEGDPPLVLDAAHNPDGARALAEALASQLAGRKVVACLAILADKDANGIVAALASVLDATVCTEIPAERLAGSGRPGARSVPAAELVLLCEEAGIPATAHADPPGAVRLARALAREREGVALVTGSHYLLRWV